jgi:ribonuclease HI
MKDMLSEEKIIWAIGSLDPFKTPGGDQLYPALLQHSKEIILPFIQEIFLKSLMFSYVPDSWQKIDVTFIPKPNENDYSSADAYRPISLMSFLLKTLEKIMDYDIKENHISKHPLNGSQHAYLAHRGTDSALHRFKNEIERIMRKEKPTKIEKVKKLKRLRNAPKTTLKKINKNGLCYAVMFDIAGAFENTNREAIIKAAELKGISKWKIDWIMNMLKTRRIRAKEDPLGTEFGLQNGVAQGSCLNPTIFLMVLDDLLVELSAKNIHVTAYADDLVITTGGSVTSISHLHNMQDAMNIIEKWCIKNNMSVSPSKSQFINFNENRKINIDGKSVSLKGKSVSIFGKMIPVVNTVKYLGVTFDKDMNWNAHVEDVISKGKQSLMIAKAYICKNYGLSPYYAKWMLDQIILSRICYGSIAWWEATKGTNVINKFRSLHRQALMLITGAVRSTPTEAIEIALFSIPIDLKIKASAMRTMVRLKQNGLWCTNRNDFDGHRGIEKIYDKEVKNKKEGDDLKPFWNFNNQYNVVIDTADEYVAEKLIKKNKTFYTDGSKNKFGVGGGIFDNDEKEGYSIRYNDDCSVFQSEIETKTKCCELIKSKNITNENILIATDCKQGLTSLKNPCTRSKTVLRCKNVLNEIAITNKVKLVLLKSHNKYTGNKEADSLAKDGANKNEVDVHHHHHHQICTFSLGEFRSSNFVEN